MLDNDNLQPKSAEQRLLEKESKWAQIVYDVAVTSPPGARTIIVTRLIGASVYVAMIPFHSEWFVYAIWTAGMVVCEWRLAYLARREFRSPKGAADTRGASEDA